MCIRDRFKAEYRKEADTHMTVNTVLFLETKSVLTALKDSGARIGIISTKYRFRIKELLNQHFPEDFMDIIVGGEDVKAAKPSPEGLLLAIKRLHAVSYTHLLPVVVNPGTGLVCLLETTDLVRGIDVLPAVTHLTCLRSPEVHTPGTCDRRIGITGGKLESRLRADKRTDIPGKVFGMQP